MTCHSCHTSTTRCRTRPLSWRPHQQRHCSRSTGKRPSWWRWTQQPTHQSHLVESPSGRLSLSSTWETWMTNSHTQNLQGKSSFRHAQKYLDILGNQRENQTPHELSIFNSNVKSVLLYRCETWWTTQTMQQKIQTFFNTYPRRIYKIQWKGKIRNEDLWERAGLELL